MTSRLVDADDTEDWSDDVDKQWLDGGHVVPITWYDDVTEHRHHNSVTLRDDPSKPEEVNFLLFSSQ